MEFINKMKKREFIEMSLKTVAAILAAFVAIILMESMIYGIYLNALKTNGDGETKVQGQTIAYCIKESEDKYFVIYHNDDPRTKGFHIEEWTANSDKYLTKQECLDLANTELQAAPVKEVVFRAPNAFEFTITGTHYIVMAVFVLAIGGFFTYKFIALSKEYKRIEENYKKTGTIEIGNM